MSERESGWYRVVLFGSCILIEWVDGFGWINMFGVKIYDNDDLFEINPEMVMTPSGELVYHKAEHDPLYNTQQEG